MKSISHISTLCFAFASGLYCPTYAATGTSSTYCAWSDQGNKVRGNMYIYTGPAASTNLNLFYATLSNMSIASGSLMTLRMDGKEVMRVAGLQNWSEPGGATLKLGAGPHTLDVAIVKGTIDLDWIEWR